MRELDILLIRFLETRYAALGPGDKARFQQLLELPDPDLHAYLLARHVSDDPELEALLRRIRSGLHS
jgi:succinate dehydrogenase flavin-adding protein (antitoxin of CptAB toxin-antitoxin module)